MHDRPTNDQCCPSADALRQFIRTCASLHSLTSEFCKTSPTRRSAADFSDAWWKSFSKLIRAMRSQYDGLQKLVPSEVNADLREKLWLGVLKVADHLAGPWRSFWRTKSDPLDGPSGAEELSAYLPFREIDQWSDQKQSDVLQALLDLRTVERKLRAWELANGRRAPITTTSAPIPRAALSSGVHDWLQPPCSLEEMGRRCGVTPHTIKKMFANAGLREATNRQSWTVDLAAVDGKFRAMLEEKSAKLPHTGQKRGKVNK